MSHGVSTRGIWSLSLEIMYGVLPRLQSDDYRLQSRGRKSVVVQVMVASVKNKAVIAERLCEVMRRRRSSRSSRISSLR